MKWFRFFDPIFSFPVIWSFHCIPVCTLLCICVFCNCLYIRLILTSRFCISVFFNCQTLKSALFVFVFVWLSPHSQGRPQARQLASPRESWPWCWATHWPAPGTKFHFFPIYWYISIFDVEQPIGLHLKALKEISLLLMRESIFCFFPPLTFTTVSVSSSLYVVVLKCFNEARIFSSSNNILACFQINGCESQATPLPQYHYPRKLNHLLVILHIYLILI